MGTTDGGIRAVGRVGPVMPTGRQDRLATLGGLVVILDSKARRLSTRTTVLEDRLQGAGMYTRALCCRVLLSCELGTYCHRLPA